MLADLARYLEISIHAPLRERRYGWAATHEPEKFQSTLPYGSDRIALEKEELGYKFQSTLPYGSDLAGKIRVWMYAHISIHAPLRERQ